MKKRGHLRRQYLKKKQFLIFTPVNPTRPYYERLAKLHQKNVKQNLHSLYNYIERECLLPPNQQSKPQLRGVNVCREFNKVYKEHGQHCKYICKWDDDILMPPGILNQIRAIFDDDPETVGVGLFQEDYGAPQILMVNQLEDGWYGAFSRFYCYRIERWREIPIDEKRGDPDNAHQIKIKGEKHVLNVPSLHLDHRCMTDRQYKVLLDMAGYFTFS